MIQEAPTRCLRPYLFKNKTRCCICGGKIATCPCTAQDAINHFVSCHVTDNCDEVGHPTVAQMCMLGLPTPTMPCRNCGEVVVLEMLE